MIRRRIAQIVKGRISPRGQCSKPELPRFGGQFIVPRQAACSRRRRRNNASSRHGSRTGVSDSGCSNARPDLLHPHSRTEKANELHRHGAQLQALAVLFCSMRIIDLQTRPINQGFGWPFTRAHLRVRARLCRVEHARGMARVDACR